MPPILVLIACLRAVDGVDLIGDEAQSVVGKTLQKPIGGWWLVGVDGFHQIHCVVSSTGVFPS